MTLLLAEGFDNYGTIAELRDKYGLIQGTAGSFPTGRYGVGQGVTFTGSNMDMYLPLPSNPSRIICGFAWRLGDGASSFGNAHTIFGLYRAGTPHMEIRVTDGGGLYIVRSTTIMATANNSPLAGFRKWHYVEIDLTVANGTGGACQVWVDGISVINLTSADTQNDNAIDGTIDQLLLNRANSSDDTWDDIYALDTNGSVNNARLGEIAIEMLLPDGDGNRNNFTATGAGTTNADRVADGTSPDDDTTYVSSATLDDDELYTFGNLTLTGDSVKAVVVRHRSRKVDGGERQMRCLARNGVAESESVATGISAEYRHYDGIFEQNPTGPANWTPAAVDASEFGVTIEA